MSRKTTAIKHVDHIVEILLQKGLSHAVVSPGSRNAPIIIALDARDQIQKHVVTDERSAGFVALGIAQQTQQPVIVVCTSGSAVLNYAPAVSEAFYQNIPLIVISADRPADWTDQGDGQTIRQIGALDPHVAKTFQVDAQHQDNIWAVNGQVNEAWEIALQERLPVHLNLPLSAPLYDQVDYTPYPKVRTFEVAKVEEQVHPETLDKLLHQWHQAERKMILIGQNDVDHGLNKWIGILADFPDVSILTENLSNVQHPKIVHCIDRTLAGVPADEIAAYQPDLLITIGSAVVSKRVKKFLRQSNIQHNWKIGKYMIFQDTYCHLTTSIAMDHNNFLSALTSSVQPDPENRFGLQWKQLDYIKEDQHNQFLQQAKYADLTVFHTLLDFLPDNSVLHLGNSSVVRYAQLFNPIRNIIYYGNRGTSGIDGSTSTAVGAALVDTDRCHTIITGDLSFFYDSNALWNHHLTENLRIIVINNAGGDIFKIIDGPSHTGAVEKYFYATHDKKAKHLCQAFNIHYMASDSIEAIEEQMISFFEIKDDKRPVLMEIHTPTDQNAPMLQKYFESLR